MLLPVLTHQQARASELWPQSLEQPSRPKGVPALTANRRPQWRLTEARSRYIHRISQWL